MSEKTKTGRTGIAALRAGMSRNTAAKYLKESKLPSEMKAVRDWRTRPDPFEQHWPRIEARLVAEPDLEARTIFEELQEHHPGLYEPGQLRTLQRRVKQWRGLAGPNKEVFFPQAHRPGEAMQTDFTWASKLGVTIQGEAFPHMLCHPVLPYSNWEWATVCHSESLAALKRGVQEALFRLGHAPRFHQTDNSTAATHDLTSGKRAFNEEYAAMVGHFGMHPRTIAVGEKEQNGDVEAMHRGLKNRLKQYLLLRGSNDFESATTYEMWLWRMLLKTNRPRQTKLGEELAVMRPVTMARLPEFTEVDTRVSSWSTISIKSNVYSVPSRLIGEKVMVRVYEGRIDVYYGGKVQLSTQRLLGRGGHRINYRHIIWSLVKKPGAFRLYRYKETRSTPWVSPACVTTPSRNRGSKGNQKGRQGATRTHRNLTARRARNRRPVQRAPATTNQSSNRGTNPDPSPILNPIPIRGPKHGHRSSSLKWAWTARRDLSF